MAVISAHAAVLHVPKTGGLRNSGKLKYSIGMTSNLMGIAKEIRDKCGYFLLR